MARKSISLVFGGNGVPLKRFLHSRLSIVSLLVLLALLVSPFNMAAGAQSNATGLNRATADWTFMVYLDADNNLESFGISDFAEMANVGSTAAVNILVQFDRIGGYDTTNGNWTDTRRFRVTKDMLPTAANGTSIGEANMGNPQTLINFVNWGMTTYPANNYAVILWDHGEGWRAASGWEEPTKGVAFDDSQGDYISSPELRSALATLSGNGANPIDLIGFDACLMAMIEVDRQLIPYADVRAGSEETIPGNGWPYQTILSDLVATPTMTANQLGTAITDRYYAYYGGYTMSAVTLGGSYNSLLNNVNNFAATLISQGGAYRSTITTARNNSQEFYDPDYIDLYDFAYEVKLRVDNSTIDTWATQVMDGITASVIRNRNGSGYAGAHGISIYFPTTEGAYDALYDGSEDWLVFTNETQWDEWLHAYYNPSSLTAPTLISPADGAATRDRTPTFRWNSVASATKYQIQIADNSGLASPVFNVTRTTTNYTATSALSNTRYYWRVRAGNSTGWGTWSTARNFTVDTVAPARPILSSPDNGSTSSDSTPSFTWKSVATATLYRFQVDNNADFSSPLINVNRKGTAYTRSTALANGLYYWRVRARDAAGNWSAWSTRWSVRVAGASPQPANTPVPTDVPSVTIDITIPTPTATEAPGEVIVDIPIDEPGPALQLVESDSAFVQQSGVWTVHDTAEASGGSYVYSSGSLDDVLSLGFYGTQIEVVYVQHPALGTFAVEIDGVVMQTVNSLAGEGVFNVRATISGLFDGQHTLRVYPVNGVMAIDAFLVEQAAEPVLPTVVPTETLVPPTDVPTDIPTETPIPPTDVPTDIPTETPIPPTEIPTETPVPPTDVPTETLIPPTDVPIETPVPPTDVPTEVPADPPAEPETVNSGG